MKITMIACDNPACNQRELPESPKAPPYGWLRMKGHFQGTGPNVQVDVCSIACLGPAVAEVVEEYYDPEHQ